MAKQKGQLTTLWSKSKELINNYTPEKAEQLSELLEM